MRYTALWCRIAAASSMLIPLIAVALITVFTVSLAMADDTTLVAARSDPGIEARIPVTGKALTSDSITDAEAMIFSAPLPAPHYHDRFRFYHRYDLDTPRARFNPLDDGLN